MLTIDDTVHAYAVCILSISPRHNNTLLLKCCPILNHGNYNILNVLTFDAGTCKAKTPCKVDKRTKIKPPFAEGEIQDKSREWFRNTLVINDAKQKLSLETDEDKKERFSKQLQFLDGTTTNLMTTPRKVATCRNFLSDICCVFCSKEQMEPKSTNILL
jgi:hypothetical protein